MTSSQMGLVPGRAAALALVGLLGCQAPASHTTGEQPRTPADSVPRSLACAWGVGGVTALSDDVRMVYAAGGDGEVARFDGGIIVRAPRWWLDRSAPRGITEIARADTNRANAGGGTVGPMLMLVQRDPRTAWLDDRRVHLGADNILLVRVANDGVLQVVGSTDVDPSLPLPDVSCAAQQERHHHFDAALEAVVARSPAVREFMR